MREFEFKEPVVSQLSESLGLELNNHEWHGANATFGLDSRPLNVDVSQYFLNEMITEFQNEKLLELINYILGCSGKSPISLQETPKVIRVIQENKEVGQFTFLVNPKKKKQAERTTFVLSLIISDMVPDFYNQSCINNETQIMYQDSPSRLQEKILGDICGQEATTEDCVSEFPLPPAPYDPVPNFFKMDDSRNMSMMLDKQHRRTSSGDLKSQVLKASILQEEHRPASSQRARSLSDDSRAKILKQEQSDSGDEISEDHFRSQKHEVPPQSDLPLNDILSNLPEQPEPVSATRIPQQPSSFLTNNIDLLIPEQLESQVEFPITSSTQAQNQLESGTQTSRSVAKSSSDLPGIPILETFRETLVTPYLSIDHEKRKESISDSIRSRLVKYQSQFSARISDFSGSMLDAEFINRFDKLMWSMELKLTESKFHKISDSKFVTAKMIMQDAKTNRILIIYHSTLLNQLGKLKLSKLRRYDFCEIFLPNLAARIAYCTALESMKPIFQFVMESPKVSPGRPQPFRSNSDQESASAQSNNLATTSKTAANILDQHDFKALPTSKVTEKLTKIDSRLVEVKRLSPRTQVNASDRGVIGSTIPISSQPAQNKNHSWQRRATNPIIEAPNFEGCSVSTILVRSPEDSYAFPLDIRPPGFIKVGEEAEALVLTDPFNTPINNKKVWPAVRYAREHSNFHDYFGKNLTMQPEFNLGDVFCSAFSLRLRTACQSLQRNPGVALSYNPTQHDCLGALLRQYFNELCKIELMTLNLNSGTVILCTASKELLLRFKFMEKTPGVSVQRLFETAALLLLRIVDKDCFLELMKFLPGNWP